MNADDPALRGAGPVVVDASAVVELMLPDPATRKLVLLDAITPDVATSAVESLVDLPISIAGTAALMPEVWRMQDFLTPHDACYVALADALVIAERHLATGLCKRKKRARYLDELSPVVINFKSPRTDRRDSQPKQPKRSRRVR